MAYQTIRFEVEKKVGVLTLNRPHVGVSDEFDRWGYRR